MKLQMKKIHCLLFCCVAFSGSVAASTVVKTDIQQPYFYTQLNHLEVMGALGAANLNAGNSLLGVTTSETDKLVQTNSNNWGTFDAQLGVGYVYYFAETGPVINKVQWLPTVEPQLNLYYLQNNTGVNGNVWRFNNPAFNQLTYKMPVRSTRLMLDAALTIVKVKQTSLYAKFGVGSAWNRIGYSDVYNGSGGTIAGEQRLNLNTKIRTSFAWELGVGLLHDFNNHIGVSLEYLYINFGTVKTSSQGKTGPIIAPVIAPAKIFLQAQTLALGLHYGI